MDNSTIEQQNQTTHTPPNANTLTKSLRKSSRKDAQSDSLGPSNLRSLITGDEILNGNVSNAVAERRRSHSGHRILIVDNCQDCADTVGLILKLEGYHIEVCYDGSSALDRGAQFLPEVVLLDLGMPNMSGLETARALRNESWGKDVLLIAMTGYCHSAMVRSAREAGFDHHLAKPFEARDLLTLLTQKNIERPASALE
jgi:CheY-like chemotaxis protein